MKHLTLRVAWHDARWNGTICSRPGDNAFCAMLDRIREDRDDAAETANAGKAWKDLPSGQLPPCKAEGGAFMSPTGWVRPFVHPYLKIKSCAETHGHLEPTSLEVPPYSAYAVPFWWMLRRQAAAIAETTPNPLPADVDPPFNSPWIFGADRQEAVSHLFFGKLQPERSLVFFYTKEGSPLGEHFPRLLIGIGRIIGVGKVEHYNVPAGKSTYPMWDRLIRHSIREQGHDGFLLPYHDYLAPTGDPAEDVRRRGLVEEIAVAPDESDVRTFSFMAEHAEPDVALSTLVRALASVRLIREHGIAAGPWAQREEWLNARIAEAWSDRGAFPGLGPALEAIGLRLGTALAQELLATGQLRSDADPWPLIDRLMRGQEQPPQAAYLADIKAASATWIGLRSERRALLLLLSRFSLTRSQALRWFDPTKRGSATSAAVSDAEIVANPYRIPETDLGAADDQPVSIGVVDRGLMPDATIAAAHPVPEPSTVGSPLDPRRVRAALVAVLRSATSEGDTLLASAEALEAMARLDLGTPLVLTSDWLDGHGAQLEGVITRRAAVMEGGEIPCLQLAELGAREAALSKKLLARMARPIVARAVDWRALLIEVLGNNFNASSARSMEAVTEQAQALERVVKRKLSVLVGRAGTGKTTVLGALLRCPDIEQEGILLLAPTGKASVRLQSAAHAEAGTVAQFLFRLGRYDGSRQRPLFSGQVHAKQRTVVIDECSMLTLDDLAAVMDALDLGYVQRIILVGDPNQLPPIGAGRPFADLVAYLNSLADRQRRGDLLSDDEERRLGALARLTVEVRTAPGSVGKETSSDTLRLASWFTREPQAPDADRVLCELNTGAVFNDLEIAYWSNPDQLREVLLAQLVKHLGLSGPGDLDGFNACLGFRDGKADFGLPNGAESFQVLSPVRMHPHGVNDLNRWVQQTFHGAELAQARERHTTLGDEQIVLRDKVIQTRNGKRRAYDWLNRAEVDGYFANGEVGVVAREGKGFHNVLFAGRPNLTAGYSKRDFPGGDGPLSLAYAITVHKAQGSEFQKVFVVIPKSSRMLSRELLYTALTRGRQRLVLLIEGNEPTVLHELASPDNSETTRRNTFMFFPAVRPAKAEIIRAPELLHRATNGVRVRSKSELVIANTLCEEGVPFTYERKLDGTAEPGQVRPDFSFTDAGGDVILWEHVGMLDREDYARGWEWKTAWYKRNGYVEGENLFTTGKDPAKGLDMVEIRELVKRIKEML